MQIASYEIKPYVFAIIGQRRGEERLFKITTTNPMFCYVAAEFRKQFPGWAIWESWETSPDVQVEGDRLAA